MLKSVLVLSALVVSCLGAAAQALAAPPMPVADIIAGRKIEALTLPHRRSKDVVFEGGSRNTVGKWGIVRSARRWYRRMKKASAGDEL